MTKFLKQARDKKLFEEMLKKFEVMGISVTWDEYQKDPKKYVHLIKEYDNAVNLYLYRNGNRQKKIIEDLAKNQGITGLDAYSRAYMMLVEEARGKIANKQICINALKEFENKVPYKATENNQPLNIDIEALIKKLSGVYNAHSRLLLDQPAKKLGKHSNFLEFEMVMNDLGIGKQQQSQFRIKLSKYNGSLREFLSDYTHPQQNLKAEKQLEVNEPDSVYRQVVSLKQKRNRLVKATKENAQNVWNFVTKQHVNLNLNIRKNYKSLKSKNKHLQKKLSRRFSFKLKCKLSRRTFLYWQKQYMEKLRAHPLKLAFNQHKYLRLAKVRAYHYKDEFFNNGKKPLIYATAALSVLGFGYGFKQLPFMKSDISAKNTTCTINRLPLRSNLSALARNYFPDYIGSDFLNDLSEQSMLDISGTSDFWQSLREGEALDARDYNLRCPYIKNDVLAYAPNVDFFNYCFKNSNQIIGKHNNYGVSKAMFDEFLRENKPTAHMYRIKSYKNLTFDQARIIAKTQIYDKYDIAFMHNQSIASYLYDILARKNNTDIAAIAQGVSDFYEVKGKTLSSKQQEALFNLAEGKSIRTSDWRQMIAVINEISINGKDEGQLFEMLRANLVQNGSVIYPTDEKIVNTTLQNDALYAFQPTINGSSADIDTQIYADNIFFSAPEIQLLNVAEYDSILTQRKDRDMEIFAKIYQQCCYDNFVNLRHGDRSKTFRDANRTLRKYGLGSLSVGLHCAGMSVASLCQATDKFSEENPESPVTKAVQELLKKCRNVHYCNSLRDDLKALTQTVIKSDNLERDIAGYMKKHKNAIIYGWAPRGKNRYHHQTFFQSAEIASSSKYVYCAFNNEHWGNEITFDRYLRSRSRYGYGGFFADIGLSIDKMACKYVKKEVREYEKQVETYKASVAAESEMKNQVQQNPVNIVYDLYGTLLLNSGIQR